MILGRNLGQCFSGSNLLGLDRNNVGLGSCGGERGWAGVKHAARTDVRTIAHELKVLSLCGSSR